jgi:hypothetical protein
VCNNNKQPWDTPMQKRFIRSSLQWVAHHLSFCMNMTKNLIHSSRIYHFLKTQTIFILVYKLCDSIFYNDTILLYNKTTCLVLGFFSLNMFYVDPNSIKRLTTKRSEARRCDQTLADCLQGVYIGGSNDPYGVCKHTPDIVKFCWLAPVVFISLCWRGFSMLKSCVSVLWFLFRSSLLPIAFITK